MTKKMKGDSGQWVPFEEMKKKADAEAKKKAAKKKKASTKKGK